MTIVIGKLFNIYERILEESNLSKEVKIERVESEVVFPAEEYRTQPIICDMCGSQVMLAVKLGDDWVCSKCEDAIRNRRCHVQTIDTLNRYRN